MSCFRQKTMAVTQSMKLRRRTKISIVNGLTCVCYYNLSTSSMLSQHSLQRLRGIAVRPSQGTFFQITFRNVFIGIPLVQRLCAVYIPTIPSS